MAETVEITKLIDDITKGVAELRTLHADTEKRLTKMGETFTRHGLDVDGEAKHNLVEAANSVADLEVLVAKLRRSRTVGKVDAGPDENGITPLLEAKSGKPVRFRDPVERARYAAMGSEAYSDAFDVALRKQAQWSSLSEEHRAVLGFSKLSPEVEALIPAAVKATGLSSDFEPGAGMFVPPAMETEITRTALEFSPFEELARTVSIGSDRYQGVIRTANRDTINPTGERQTPTQATQLKRYEKRGIDVNLFTVYPALTQQILEDSAIDLAAELQTDAGEDFGVLRGAQFLKGTGVDEPEGLMVSALIGSMASGLAATFDMDSIKRLPQELKVTYKVRGTYLLSRTALTTLMLFREDSGGVGTGPYLWEPSTQAGTPSRLNGFNWREMVDLDAVAANAFPIAFGDFFRAYRIVERRGVRVLRDELTADPFVVYRMSRRYGGRVWLGEAAVKMKCAVSL